MFGVEDATLATLKGGIEAVVSEAGHRMAETDAEQGANLMIFLFRAWEELLAVPDLHRLVQGLERMLPRLAAEGANQYRHFRFEQNGAIRACTAFVRMDEALAGMPADAVALGLAVRSILLWSGSAFRDRAPIVRAEGRVILSPEIAALIRAAYDPAMPEVARDRSHALRLAARLHGRGL